MIIGNCPVCGAEMRVGTDMTNADRIRLMTDEELAGQIAEWNNGDCPPIELCPKRRNEFTHYIECAPWKCWLDWLKEEVDNETD